MPSYATLTLHSLSYLWKRKLFNVTAQVIASLLLSSVARAQEFPSKTIRLVVPFTPGTSMDVVARMVAPAMSRRLNQPVIVENMPGATGTIGSLAVARSEPDGHTLLVTSNNIVVAPLLMKKAPFDPLVDFVPITITSYSAMTLVASIKSDFSSVAQFVAAAKSDPGKMSYSSPGIGTTQHISMEVLKNVVGLDIVHVPYRGSAGALNDIVIGEVPIAFVPVDLAAPQHRSGTLRILAVGSPTRHPMLPEISTLRENGILDADSNPWHAFAAPKGTPRAIIDKLNSEIRTILDMPDVKGKLNNAGLVVSTGTPEEMVELMKSDSARAAIVIKQNKISIN